MEMADALGVKEREYLNAGSVKEQGNVLVAMGEVISGVRNAEEKGNTDRMLKL